jgi:hypothetical protein
VCARPPHRIGNEDVSACTIAKRQGIFCRGFARFSDAELRDRYQWIVRRRQEVSDMCRGWDSFSNDELARFYFEMTGQSIVIG